MQSTCRPSSIAHGSCHTLNSQEVNQEGGCNMGGSNHSPTLLAQLA
jgi:hypothetical protein